ncbi:hypothetical protein [Picosynechococcus sp. PCC 11901]|uniref:hypothetical protein n=1 Tax=Picosynechococcus sp. PCC 11901 TaxID=2579791 RepID=UPI0030D89215
MLSLEIFLNSLLRRAIGSGRSPSETGEIVPPSDRNSLRLRARPRELFLASNGNV